jgi:hypothetical protein
MRELFGTGVGRRREQGAGRAGAVAGVGQQARDAEVEQHGTAVGTHHHVAGFDVAVDHEALVREMHGTTQAREQAQARFE